ncbi:DapH/DapD/GlmU-related protein [Singulisphaera sp. PoT]|uniref:DapH/DapD/GlmU-related protein n=1 Tax=Singulisphaera sp. PoT TaxID=3411797 RepID=UPI003BF5C74B
MDRLRPRRSVVFRPQAEAVEGRLLLSTVPQVNPANAQKPFLRPFSVSLKSPNTPISPFQASSKLVTFVDPSAKLVKAGHVLAGYKNYLGPYALLDASTGMIKIGSGSNIQANANILSNPTGRRGPTTSVLIGSNVSIGFGATVSGPSTIGAFPNTSKPTIIGPNAVIDGATVQPGAVVSALAKVEPGVTVPTGVRVLPGVDVTSNAEASDPALGKVVTLTAGELTKASQTISIHQSLAQGYATLYQGNSATGNFGAGGITSTPLASGVFQGNLTTITGAGPEPGSATVSFEPSSGSPTFAAPMGQQAQSLLYNFPARVTGQVNFYDKASDVAANLGIHDAILGDQGQPINIGPITRIGNGVTITSPLGSTTGPITSGTSSPISIGQGLIAGDHAVILGAQGVKVVIEDNVTIGSSAVVEGSSIGANSTIGARAYVLNSNLPAGSSVRDGAIVINNKQVGTVAS